MHFFLAVQQALQRLQQVVAEVEAGEAGHQQMAEEEAVVQQQRQVQVQGQQPALEWKQKQKKSQQRRQGLS